MAIDMTTILGVLVGLLALSVLANLLLVNKISKMEFGKTIGTEALDEVKAFFASHLLQLRQDAGQILVQTHQRYTQLANDTTGVLKRWEAAVNPSGAAPADAVAKVADQITAARKTIPVVPAGDGQQAPKAAAPKPAVPSADAPPVAPPATAEGEAKAPVAGAPDQSQPTDSAGQAQP